ncbi:hypothetical protein NPIL_404811, partial [Nephila pilipes]
MASAEVPGLLPRSSARHLKLENDSGTGHSQMLYISQLVLDGDIFDCLLSGESKLDPCPRVLKNLKLSSCDLVEIFLPLCRFHFSFKKEMKG